MRGAEEPEAAGTQIAAAKPASRFTHAAGLTPLRSGSIHEAFRPFQSLVQNCPEIQGGTTMLQLCNTSTHGGRQARAQQGTPGFSKARHNQVQACEVHNMKHGKTNKYPPIPSCPSRSLSPSITLSACASVVGSHARYTHHSPQPVATPRSLPRLYMAATANCQPPSLPPLPPPPPTWPSLPSATCIKRLACQKKETQCTPYKKHRTKGTPCALHKETWWTLRPACLAPSQAQHSGQAPQD